MDKDLAGVDPATLERLKALVRGGVAHCGAADIAPFSGTICDLSVCQHNHISRSSFFTLAVPTGLGICDQVA